MATPISSVTIAPPPTSAGVGSNVQTAPADDAFANLFRSAVATLTGEVTPARDAAIAAQAAEAGQVAAEGLVDPVLLDETDSDADAAALAGLFGLGVPVNFADPAAATAVGVGAEALPPGVVPGIPPEDSPSSRTNDLRFGFAGGPAPARGLTVTNLPTPPDNPEPAPQVAANPAPVATPAEAVPAPAPAPVFAADSPRAIANLVANRLIPAQVPVEAANPAVPPGGALVDPTTVAPVAAVAGTAPTPPVAATAADDRPSVAGDKFAAIAEAGARLAAPPAQAAAPPDAPPTAFATTLAAQTPAVAAPADVPPPTLLPADANRVTASPAPATVPGATPAVTPQAVAAPVEVRDAATPTARPTTVPVATPVTDTEVPVEAAAQTLLARGPVTVPTRAAAPAVVTAAPAPAESFAAALRVEASPEADPATDNTPTATATPVPPAAPPQATNSPAPAATVAPTPAAQIAGEITAQTRTLDRDGSVEFRMQLDPPDLGRVRVNLVSTGDEVRGQIVVADDAVRRVIEGQLPELRQRLEAAGVTVQGFDVTTADPGAGGGGAAYREAAPAEDVPIVRTGPARPRAARAAGGLDVLA
jgi:hypothetical protein